jgi:UDP:flavonoid glycosyltransferase YjiC (YdhE family)
VHFPYGPARRQIVRGDAWTTDLPALESTRRALALTPAGTTLTAWEAVDLLLVTAPRWFDVEQDYPAHVVRAAVSPPPAGTGRILLSFSTTVMDGQPALIERVCEAVADAGLPATLTLGPSAERARVRTPDALEVVAWGDHDALMPRCAAVVTHGGLGTTLRALAHGVPLLALPLGRDQAFNAARVDGLGAGIRLDAGAGASAIRHALDRLLHERRYAGAAADVAARIVAERPDARAAAALGELSHRVA